MTEFSNTFGLTMRNFQKFPEQPDAQELIEFGIRAEKLGYDSLWVWDHVLLGVDPHFPIIDALSLLTAISVGTKSINLGTGILVLPVRNPVLLAKQLSSMDLISGGRLLLGMASGWYKREFDALGVPFNQRGKIMDENLDTKMLGTEVTVAIREWEKKQGSRKVCLIIGFSSQEGPAFIEYAKTVPITEKIHSSDDLYREHIIRKLASDVGVPEISCSKRKKALQYGSKIHKSLLKTR